MANFSEIPWIAEHIQLYKPDPEKAHMWDSTPLGGPGLLPTLLLTTTGRKSGELRSLPLIYGEADGGYVIIGQLMEDVAGKWSHAYSREQAVFPAPWLREHKFWPPVGRIDNPYGDRNLVCSCS